MADKLSVGILGSCVTRDVFKYLQQVEILYYVARSSLASIYAPPLGQIPSSSDLQVDGHGVFENRMVQHDILKSSRSVLGESTTGPLIMDFIDERFELLRIEGTVITRTGLLMMTAYGRSVADGEMLRRSQPEAIDLWEVAARKLLAEMSGRKIILHRALWAKRYRDDDTGEILDFSDADVRLVDQQNALLNHYYDYIEARHGDLSVVIPDPELIWSNFAHRWGRDFFHFGDAYYAEIAQKIGTILS